jgi:hypothetical protein
MPVMSSQMGSSRASTAPPEEDEVQGQDESIWLTREQIKAMSIEEIHAHLDKLNAIATAPRTAKKPKVDATGAATPKRGVGRVVE